MGNQQSKKQIAGDLPPTSNTTENIKVKKWYVGKYVGRAAPAHLIGE